MSLPREANTQAEIVRSLHLHPNTVHKYLRMPTFVAHYCHPYPTPREPYRTYLEERGPEARDHDHNSSSKSYEGKVLQVVIKVSGCLCATGPFRQG
jgi:hypothetical protein